MLLFLENESSEITDCVYVEINKNRFIIAVGWDQRINIFPDQTDYFHHIHRPMPHWPDDLVDFRTSAIQQAATRALDF